MLPDLRAVRLANLKASQFQAVYTSQAEEPGKGEGPMTPGPVTTGDRVSVGVSGYISSIPKAYEQEAVLTGRPGIVSAYSSWGQVMQASGGSVKLSLEDDEYNRVVHCKQRPVCDLPQLH